MELVKYDEEKGLIVEENVINLLKEFQRSKVQIEIQEKQLREELLEAMEKYGITNWETMDGSIKAIYSKPYKKSVIDSTRLKKELPDVAEEYSKESNVSASVKLTIEV